MGKPIISGPDLKKNEVGYYYDFSKVLENYNYIQDGSEVILKKENNEIVLEKKRVSKNIVNTGNLDIYKVIDEIETFLLVFSCYVKIK